MNRFSQYLVIAGPTASGKSSLATRLAEKGPIEIISADSIQLYKGFDIGSAKPTKDWLAKIPHHMIDVCAWHEECNAGQYALLVKDIIDAAFKRGNLPVVVGGSGLYIRALLGNQFHIDLPSDPALRKSLAEVSTAELYLRLQKEDLPRSKEVHPNDRFRLMRALELAALTGKSATSYRSEAVVIDPRAITIILNPPRADLHQSIAKRTEQMLEKGLVSEVKFLLENGVDPSAKPLQSIGYKQALSFVQNKINSESLKQEIINATRQYAKKQCTWFKKAPANLRIETADPNMQFEEVLQLLETRF